LACITPFRLTLNSLAMFRPSSSKFMEVTAVIS
jgi:hypothetical protein